MTAMPETSPSARLPPASAAPVPPCGMAGLRIEESDRFAAMVVPPAADGVPARADGDDPVVSGPGVGGVPGGGRVEIRADHRLATGAAVPGIAFRRPVPIDGASFVGTSFPGFTTPMAASGCALAAVP